MYNSVVRLALLGIAGALSVPAALPSQPPPTQPPPQANPAAQPGATNPQGTAQGQQPRRPRPYAQVITNRAISDAGGITTHRVDDRFFFEVPDSLVRRDFLFVSRVAGVPAGLGGFTSAGTSVEERLVRWERTGDRLVLRSLAVSAYADDSLPIAKSV